MAEAARDTLAEEDTQHGRYMSFKVGEETYALALEHVTEIIGMHPVTTVPETPEYVLGIINLRGKVIPVMDMRLRFHKEPKAYTERTCVIVVDLADVTVGLVVDSVCEVAAIGEAHIEPPPDFRSGLHNRFLAGIAAVQAGAILLLDCEKLLETPERIT